jgi:hypothetical protein
MNECVVQRLRRGSVERQVLDLILQSRKFFSFIGFLENINGGGHFKTSALVNGIHFKMLTSVNWLTEVDVNPY